MFLRPSKLPTDILLVLVFCQFIAPAFVPVTYARRSSQVEVQKHPKQSLTLSLLFEKYEKEEKEDKKERDKHSAFELLNFSLTHLKYVSAGNQCHPGNESSLIPKAPLYLRHCVYII
jgi:hypothetical protein